MYINVFYYLLVIQEVKSFYFFEINTVAIYTSVSRETLIKVKIVNNVASM